MNENIVYTKMVKWTDKYVDKREFIVLWSDHTWDEFRFVWNNKSIKDLKKHFCLKQLVTRKVDKGEAIKFINSRIKEIESI